MGRIRTIKPEFFTHSGLFDAEQETHLPLRLAFAGLWTQCDREGRFKWRPRELKLAILPYDDCDFSRVLDALATRGFTVKYASESETFGYIPSWKEHQYINNKEIASHIPNPIDCQQLDACSTRDERVTNANDTRGVKEGNVKERNIAAPGKPSAECVTLYKAYPRHVGPNAAYKAIAKALQAKPFDYLLTAVNRFSKTQGKTLSSSHTRRRGSIRAGMTMSRARYSRETPRQSRMSTTAKSRQSWLSGRCASE